MELFRPKTIDAQGDTIVRQTHSSDSLELPWERIRTQHPIIVAENQTGRLVSPDSFFLCFIAFLQMASGLGLLCVSLWSFIRKFPYTYLIEVAVDITYFSIPGALICFVCFWIAASTMNQRNPPFLPLLLVFMLFSSVLLVTGTYMGFIYKSKLKFNKTIGHELITKITKSEFVTSMGESIVRYDISDSYKYAWDATQRKLECCGILNASDWLNIRSKIPETCCGSGMCTLNNSYEPSCLNAVAHDIYWYKVFISSLNIIVIGVHVLSMSIIGFLYYWWKKCENVE